MSVSTVELERFVTWLAATPEHWQHLVSHSGDGRVYEQERLRLGTAPESRVSGPGTTLLVPPTAIHRVLHAGDGPAVTIHAYSPPLTRTGAYRVGPGGELERASLPYDEELRAEPALR